MKIAALRFFNVKRFAGRGVAIENISDGVNVLCAANEFGKSTSFEALHALFFQSHTGTPGDVQRLRPYSGGNPLVEADIATETGRYRLTKQFYGGRRATVTDLGSGRLLAQADEAENFIASLIRGGTAGPAGLLWVRQGVTGIERRSKSEEDGERQVRTSLLESVQGEVEAVTGGRRMAEIVAACADELALLVTSNRKPKAGGRYAAAVQEHEQLVAEERRLSGEVAELRAALDKRAAALKRLGELENPQDKAERQSDVERAQAAFEAAKAYGDVLKAAEAGWKLGRDRRDTAVRELTAYRDALSKAQRIERERAQAEHARDGAAARRRAVGDAIDAAIANAQAAETSEQEARTLLARLDAALKAREAAEQLAELQDRLEQAEAARKALEEGEAALALLAVSPKAIDELQAVEIEIVGLRAAEAAGQSTVSIAYDDGATSWVSIDGTPLQDGEERFYRDQALVSIPGIGQLTLRSNRPPRTDGRLEKAEDMRRNLLARMGVDSLASARLRQVEAQRQAAELDRLRNRIEMLAPRGLPALREDVARRSAASTGVLELKGDPEAARAALAQAGEAVTAARNVLREVQPARTGAEAAFVAAETAIATLRAEAIHADAILGPEPQRAERQQALAASAAECEAGLTALDSDLAALRARAVDLDTAEAVLRRTKSVADAVTRETGLVKETLADLNAVIRTRSDEAIEEQWREAADALGATAARVAAFEHEVAVLQRLLSALEAARAAARDLYLKPVMTELRPLLSLLFDEVSITFDDRTLLPQTILRNGQEEDVERLSGGMREQLSVLTRLAFARLLARDGRPAPVILDDALVYSDDDRIERMFDALHRQSRDQQIIVFSCRQRAFAKLGGNALQMTDWHPSG
jgi:hypothetical protein